MAREIGLSGGDYTGSQPLYFVAYRLLDSMYVIGAALEVYNAAHWSSYAVAMQKDTASGDYFGDFPAVADGLYLVKIYEQLGGSPATSDNDLDADDELDWSSVPVEDVSASEMVLLIKTALKKSPAAVINVVVDGQTVQYNRAQAIEELKFWQREAAAELGLRPRIAQIRLDGI